MNIYAEPQGKTDYEKFKWIIAEIDHLINEYVNCFDEEFKKWHIKAERFLIRKFGENSFEHKKFLDTPFRPINEDKIDGAHEDNIYRLWCEEGLRACRIAFKTYLEDMAEENTAIIQTQNATDSKVDVNPANYIYTRIDELIKKCESCQTDSTYDEIIYELDELLVSLVGKSHNSYTNFTRIVGAKATYSSKCYALKGVLLGIKNYLEIANNNKKYQIFISSTYKDLINYRSVVSDEITFRGHIPAGMEDFTACGDDLETYIKRVIDDSDYYVLIIGQRFGSSIPTDENISYTMLEYEYAKSKGMRILPFIYNGTQILDGNDLDVNKDKFDRFVSQISKSVPQYFKDENELARKLTKALENEMKNHPQKGWIRL